jgi:uncharacterized membrane protein YphA (DoxX/SURF4 family)
MTIKIIRNIARYIIAVVFIFSGFVKAVDPLGSTYKFQDYFEAFGMEFLNPLALILAILLSSAELLIGLCLFFKIRMKVASWALLVFMSFFTLLTLILALTNPVTDCGCFGDAIILTNWQTFYKNIFLFIPALIIFQQRKKFESYFTAGLEWIMAGVLFSAAIVLSVYCLRALPLIDFRPYRVGTNISEGMQIPEGAPADQYRTVLVYEKEGKKKEFSLDSPEQPWSDSSWTWAETKNILVSKGYTPPIHDFSLVSADGNDITEDLLMDTGYSFLVLANDLNKADKKGLERIGSFTKEALGRGYKVYGMTASAGEIVGKVKEEHRLPFEFYTTDDITLKTMIRSNPGLMLIKEGTVLGIWHHRNIPDKKFFMSQSLSRTILDVMNKRNNYLSLLVVMIIGLIASILFFFRPG